MKTKKIPLTCRMCKCFRIVERIRWNPETRQDEIKKMGKCYGVSEPFDILPEDYDKPCVAYPGEMIEMTMWPDFHGLTEALVYRGFNSTKEVLKALDSVKETPYGEEE